MVQWQSGLRLLLVMLFGVISAAPVGASSTPPPYQTATTQWQAAQGAFAGWTLSGVALSGGALTFNGATAQAGTDPYPPGAYNGGNFYNGGSFKVGEATGPITLTDFGFSQAIASWNAATPAGTWIETQLRVRVGARWTKWYNMGVWAADTGTVQRHSVNGQGDADGTVATDTLILSSANKKAPVIGNAYQLKFRLFSAGSGVPSVRNGAVTVSTTPAAPTSLPAGNPALWGTLLDLPQCSQMVYPDGGPVWCSPTSTSMVLGYWDNDTGPCEPRVRAAVAGVYDWIYDGHGNWPFNTAYAATHNLNAVVARFTSFAQAEPWIAAGVPVVISYAWGKRELTGAPIPTSNGHLAVLVGFDSAGNPILNDPAAPSNDTVRRMYLRSELEPLWLKNSGGTVYLIYPPTLNNPPPLN
ncbi:MAG TPA: peptidase C39 family protein [Chloroflexia bacterium]|nr:peptidase C39 family protein [Chloroflexia bacterium]